MKIVNIQLNAMKNINLGIAITVCKELRAIRRLENRLRKYKLYTNFNKWNLEPKVKRLINRLEVFKKILKTGKIGKGVNNETCRENSYEKLRKHVMRMKTVGS